jgi:hypothetical protein
MEFPTSGGFGLRKLPTHAVTSGLHIAGDIAVQYLDVVVDHDVPAGVVPVGAVAVLAKTAVYGRVPKLGIGSVLSARS